MNAKGCVFKEAIFATVPPFLCHLVRAEAEDVDEDLTDEGPTRCVHQHHELDGKAGQRSQAAKTRGRTRDDRKILKPRSTHLGVLQD